MTPVIEAIDAARTRASSALTAKDATLSASGPASLRATVTNAVKLSATGTATIAIDGGPACERKVSGSAVVTGCR